jgi:hypothetical protein
MAKFQSPLLGYNNNVRHKNRVFHIQTEDSGVNHPHIITHLFMDGGRILKSVKKSYAEYVGVEGMNDTVRGLMKDQHKAMFIALRDGQFDYLVDGGPAPAAAAATAAAAAATAAAATAAAATAAAATSVEVAAVTAAARSVTAPEIVAPLSDVVAIPLVADIAVVSSSAVSAPPTSPDPPRPDIELPPNTIDDRRPANASVPPPASAAPVEPRKPRVEELPPPAVPAAPPPPRELVVEDVPMTTRQPPEARPDAVAARAKSPSGRELTLDFDALDRVAPNAASPSLFHSSDLPPPPKNLFATKEPGTGGTYRAVETDPHHKPRHDSREEAGGRSFSVEEPGSRSGRSPGPPPSTREKSPQPARVSTRVPASRPAEARYAPARPAAIFGNTQRPQPQSLFNDELVSDKSLDEVILSYLAEDLEPPRRK